MVQIFKTNISRLSIRLNQSSMLISMCIDFLPILEQTICHISVETRNQTSIFVTNNLITVKSTCINRSITREFNGLITYRRQVQTDIVREITFLITPIQSKFPSIRLHATYIHPYCTIPVRITNSKNILFLIKHIF